MLSEYARKKDARDRDPRRNPLFFHFHFFGSAPALRKSRFAHHSHLWVDSIAAAFRCRKSLPDNTLRRGAFCAPSTRRREGGAHTSRRPALKKRTVDSNQKSETKPSAPNSPLPVLSSRALVARLAVRLQWQRASVCFCPGKTCKGCFMRSLFSTAFFLLLSTVCLPFAGAQAAAPARLPNIVIIYIDDMGYADIGPFGAKGYTTPNLDKMAAEGMKFTSFYSAQAVCSASRAALMTGCYSNRVGIAGALGPRARIGISDKEMTLAQLCKQKNYATAIFGKWHLASVPPRHSCRRGTASTNTTACPTPMTCGRRTTPIRRRCRLSSRSGWSTQASTTQRVAMPAHDATTSWYEHAVKFIERSKDGPFLLYVRRTAMAARAAVCIGQAEGQKVMKGVVWGRAGRRSIGRSGRLSRRWRGWD